MYKNLYINGCSFTAGHKLEVNQSWPFLLAKSLELNLICSAKNGNSSDTISTISNIDLSTMDPEDTYVVIGTTWPERRGIMYKDAMVNTTPGDINKKEKDISAQAQSKTSTDRRVSSLDKSKKLEEIANQLLDLPTKLPSYDYVHYFKAYTSYYKKMMLDDPKSQRNSTINYLLNHINLQNFLKVNGFNFTFVRFQSVNIVFQNQQYIEDITIQNLIKQVDQSKIIAFVDEKSDPQRIEHLPLRLGGSHPTSKACEYIANTLKNYINER